LESALLCPAKYFFLHILGLRELAEFEPGITPRERGQVVHSILASFVLLAIRKLKETGLTYDDLAGLLIDTATDAIRPNLTEAVWQVELERLTGGSGSPGLLMKWLEAEWERKLQGWSWIGVERQFDGLEISGCPAVLKGRLDRIDLHPSLGLICWDYKTGRLPGRTSVIDENDRPQLKAYLLALSKGSVTGAPKTADGFGAGYIELRSPANTKHHVMFDPAVQHGPFLASWEKQVRDALSAIFSGDISPRWVEKDPSCKDRCAYRHICGSP
jgi:ATP-dependent helicase/nuclease subunit B